MKLVQAACVRHPWWQTEAKLAIVFTYFCHTPYFFSDKKFRPTLFFGQKNSTQFFFRQFFLFIPIVFSAKKFWPTFFSVINFLDPKFFFRATKILTQIFLAKKNFNPIFFGQKNYCSVKLFSNSRKFNLNQFWGYLGFGIWDSIFGIWYLGLGIPDWGSGTWDLGPKLLLTNWPFLPIRCCPAL